MGRKPRTHFVGAIYHAYSRGVDRRAIFLDDADRRAFINVMDRCVRACGAILHAYCLMPNHFHLAIEVGEVPLSAIMQRLLTAYCQIFNARHDRTGHLFEARHHANICLDDRYLTALIRYIHMNPVRAKLVARPQDWPWSSCAAWGDSGVDLEGFDPWGSGRLESALLRKETEGIRPLADIAGDVSLRSGVSVERIRSRDRRTPVVDARMLVAAEAVRIGHPAVRVAEWLHVAPCTMTRYGTKSYAKNDRPDTIFVGK
ncbi:MAG: transposase [Elusimicrobia bacterium]|nr:transposase [Elusimicrobiota bacterium]